MNWRQVLLYGMAGLGLAGGTQLAADSLPTNAAAATPAVFVPDTTHQNEPLPDGVLAWDSLTKETNIAANITLAQFIFVFTNVSPASVTILGVYPGCHCTTAELPPLPWNIPAGTNAQFGVTVNLAERSGPSFKTVTVKTDQGFKQLLVKINVLPPALPALTDDERARNVDVARADRQTILRGDCATCHVDPGAGKYGKPLYDAVCAICHDSDHRAAMVPDLHGIKTPTTMEFWQTWIARGKAGSLMPAFSTADGGPLSDMQIISLVQYLAATIPSPAPR
jgi:mono/diheme cytochrome c family protein